MSEGIFSTYRVRTHPDAIGSPFHCKHSEVPLDLESPCGIKLYLCFRRSTTLAKANAASRRSLWYGLILIDSGNRHTSENTVRNHRILQYRVIPLDPLEVLDFPRPKTSAA
jgi:hypothetical protein